MNLKSIAFTICAFLPKIVDKVYLIAMPWLIYELTQSSFYMGLMFLVETLPFIIISPLSGILADKVRHFSILVATLLIQIVGLLAISLFIATNPDYIWPLLILGFIICGAGACYLVVFNTSIPLLFEKDKLIKANSLFQFTDTITVILGASLAAVMINLIGLDRLFTTISGLLMLTIFVLLIIRKPLNKPNDYLSANKGVFSELNEAFTFIIKHKPLFSVTFLALIGNIANGVLVSMLVFYIRDDLSLGASTLSMIYISGAVAQFLALFIVPKLRIKLESMKIMLMSQILCGFGILVMGLTELLWLLIIGFAIQNAAVVIYNVLNRTFRQTIVPHYLLGRVNGLNQMLVRSTFPFAGFFAGIVTVAISVPLLYTITALISMLVVLPFWFSKLRNISDEESEKMVENILEFKNAN